MGERIVVEQERLRRPSAQVEFNPKARFLARRLSTAAGDGRNVRGIAAPQIGVHQHMFYWNFSGMAQEDCGVSVDRGGLPASGIACNVVLLESSEETWDREERCLSFPRKFVVARRPVTGVFEWFTHRGERQEVTLGGMAARVWMHELDHCNGVLMVDRAAPGMELHRVE